MNKRFSRNTKTWRKSTIEDFESVEGGLRDIYIGDILNSEQARRALYSVDEDTGQVARIFTPSIDWDQVDYQIKREKENF